MKRKLVASALILLSLAPATTLSQERMRLTRYVYGHKYTVKVFDEDIEKMPSWNPETEEAPLSPRKAVEIARRNFTRFITTDTEKWLLDNVGLSQIGRPGSNKWLYQVEFTNRDILFSDMDWGFSIFIRMDGTIIEPEVVPNDGKVRVY